MKLFRPTGADQATRSRTRQALTWVTSGALAATMLFAGCSSDTTPAPSDSSTTQAVSTPVEGGELTWGVEVNLTTVNPHRNGQDKANPILGNAFSPYLFRNGDGEFEPWIAKGYDISDDSLTYTLTLRDDVTFTDGTKLDADAAKLNIDKLSDPGYVSNTPGGLRFLKSVKVVDPVTLEFKLSKPDIQFLLFLASKQSSPLSPKTFDLPQTTLEPGGPELAGVGPFKITSFTPSTELVLEKNTDYKWVPASFENADHPAPYLDKVTYRTLAEGSTRSGALLQGQVDVASDIQPLDVATFQDDPKFQYERTFVGGTPYAYYLNVSKPPFDDIKVRQAFVLGADYPAILQSIYQGTYERAWAPLSMVGPFGDPSLEGWAKVDIDKANQLLDEAGWTEKNDEGIRVKDGKTLTVTDPSGSAYIRESRDQLAIAIGAALKQNVGIEYIFEPLDAGTEQARADANDLGLFDNSYGGADPVTGVDLLYYSSDPTRGFIARGHYDDKELEALIDKARFTTDLNVRKEAYTAFQKLVTEKYYSLPLYQTQDTFAAKATVHGFTIDSGTGQPRGATTVWVEK